MARGKVKYRDVVGKGHIKKKKPKNQTEASAMDEINVKKQKVENVTKTETSSESDTETEDDNMKKLLNTFGGQLQNKNSVATDSSSSSSSESETENENIENESFNDNSDSDVNTEDEDENLLSEMEDVEEQNERQNKDQVSKSEKESFTEEDIEENEINIETETQKESDIENLNDPFVKHLFYELHDNLLESIQSNPVSVNVCTASWPELGKLCIQIPKCEIDNEQNSEFSISEKKIFAPPGEIPKKLDYKDSNVNDLRTFVNADEIRHVYCLHVVNHVLKTRIKVIHHNARLPKKDEVPEEFRDQGLVRPKVLIIVPFKDAAYKVICTIIDILLPDDKGNVMNKKRFMEDYTGNELIFPKKNPKPEDYEQTFQGNTSDDFKIGLTVTKKKYKGKIRVANPIEFGCINQVFVQLPHVFHRFDAQNAVEALDARFEFFINKILPPQKESLMKQTLIFIPNYFDYVRVRNYFKREDIGFVQICEYSKEGKIARARDIFYHGDAHFLLYTERYHFFNRKQIKGIRHLIFYQPPTVPHFYYEMCNLMQEANMNKKVGNVSNMAVTVIYSKYDVHQLAYIVGTERAAKMSHSERKVHMMVTGGD
ncbi:hypothetical protein NQ314_007571 [Rhamnusium bicolor]|uniref:Digestive organ expansion factor homolog n=1 Tax=Rhamnusium bicolor TaxID=1586634 RepID=A0AAV8YLW0_9CUCU|nr:hypothetical protein NQ314_007571 [Rhamnusium bicolor]